MMIKKGSQIKVICGKDKGKNGEVKISAMDKEYAPPQICAMVLQKLKQTAEEYLGETVKDAVNQIKKGLKNAVPYLDDIGYSTLGGEHRISILGKLSIDPKKEWPNGILQNSRWALIHFQPDGTLDTIRMSGWTSYEQRKKVPILRKSINKSLKQAIDRMGKYFTVVRTKYPK